ncbi:hypothetical protein ABI_21610 [Asticcacaulis biprosthecium C19]|uniref:Uncharacterized protein n=1 Tax=Asticcacaulis biprosthecium C19 TaxID=715226 RepID=F4QGW6_9CAUL|nr:hypothetical protein ABI_21610 [Asticcacaulis biprosthecium C19]
MQSRSACERFKCDHSVPPRRQTEDRHPVTPLGYLPPAVPQ